MITRYGLLCIAALISASLVATNSFAEVVINEIHYNPQERGLALEFIELLNTGDRPVNLDGWSLDEAVTWTFPPATTIKPGGLLLVAQDPQLLAQHYGATALGPWNGKLKNQGEKIKLVDRSGKLVDHVEYASGFPWPTMAAGGGGSMELIHPDIDNNLAGSWRTSLPSAMLQPQPPQIFVAAGDLGWRYHLGKTAPSGASGDWRKPVFDDSNWKKGQAPVGYGDGDDRTVLPDMMGEYSTVYLRNLFEIDAKNPIPDALNLRVYSDDGAVVWINNVEVARLGVQPGELSHQDFTIRNHEAAWESVTIANARRNLRPGKNVVAVLALNASLDSSDFSIDLELRTPPLGEISATPSPGAPNHASVKQPPAQIRQVKHEPASPKSGTPVTISAKITDPDGVSSVRLLYQVVAPGAYLVKEDSEYEKQWTPLVMQDEDGDSVFEVSLPATLQQHRHLIRYRIEAIDGKGAMVRVPYNDDQQPNFAYFCYDGAPAWTGANRPGVSAEVTFGKDLMNGLPAIHLLAKPEIVEGSQYEYTFNEVFQTGTLVVGDYVYDHIRFRNRGETTTYMVGKNKWRFNFNRTREFKPHVLDGLSTQRRWKRLNLNPGTVPYYPQFRGSASLNERLAFRIYQLAGIPAPDTAYVQLRIADDVRENGSDQYSGDLWGLYMAFEAIDGFMLDNQGEPDGELHRISQTGNSVERPPVRPVPPAKSFETFWRQIQREQPEAWWRANVDLERYYSFHAVSIATARTDQKLIHNHFLYRHPERGWQPLPWDTDQCLRPVAYEPDGLRWHTFLKNCLEHKSIRIAYQNRSRELLDLLFTKDQIGPLVDELVRDLGPAEKGFPVVDQFVWNYHPRTEPSHRGTFLLKSIGPVRHRDGQQNDTVVFDQPGFAGRVKYFKDYLTESTFAVAPRRQPKRSIFNLFGGTKTAPSGDDGKRYRGMGFRHLQEDISDPQIPGTPVIRRVGGAQSLRFRTSPFKDPQGDRSFAGMEWRVGEVYNPMVKNFKAGDHHRYEVTPVWESPIIKPFKSEIEIPATSLRSGRTYRVRVRFQDNTNRWSHWSAPIEVVVSQPDLEAYRSGILISEIMYHPAELASGESGSEFIELLNVGDVPIDLGPLRFGNGIDFEFSQLKTRVLQPGARFLIVSDVAAFKEVYPAIRENVAEWKSGKLDNSGERLTLFHGDTVLFDIEYDDQEPWPTDADGKGRSLELIHPSSNLNVQNAKSWKASNQIGGSPGE